MQRAPLTPKAKLLLRAVLIGWMGVLFPIAMSAKTCTVLAYCVVLAAAVLFGVKQRRTFSTALAISFAVLVGTICLPVDLSIIRGSSVGVRWIAAGGREAVDAGSGARAPKRGTVLLREPDLSIGVKTRWVLQISLL
jgi:hypothetical protein